jgi:hypothetical protein
MMKKLQFIILILFFSPLASLYAINDLTVKVPDSYTSKPGYMRNQVLVVEPHGGYVEQSLYLEYSDNNALSPSSNIEIIHRFELPKGSVVNDLWLWIDGKIMQALILDTWTARHIYDSIVSMKRDPAFLAKKGDQYELHVYPLKAGSSRKIKMNFITPTQWLGKQATAELPIKFLSANNSVKKPLDVLFRTTEDVWGTPLIKEFPSKQFDNFEDTLNYNFKHLYLDDITGKTTLTLSFSTEFNFGYFSGINEVKNDLTYFQLGVMPEKFFNIRADSSSHNFLVGIDLSGKTNNNIAKIMPNLKNVLKSAITPKDTFNIVLAGAGMYQKISETPLPGTALNIDTLCDRTINSKIADSLQFKRQPVVLFCDPWAYQNWNFNTLTDYATKINSSNITQAADYFKQADVVASYAHGYESILTDNDAAKIWQKMDTLLMNGGRVIIYYDMNRNNVEKIAAHYINGLNTKSVNHSALTLYRNVNGNIGGYFPAQFDRNAAYFFSYNDPDVKTELTDINGNATVISKKVFNGLMIVTGMWEFNDDNALKTMLGIPLFGLNKNEKSIQYFQLLNEMRNAYSQNKFDKAIVFSSSDSVVQKTDAAEWVKNYKSKFQSKVPSFNHVNLLDGSVSVPAYLTDNQIDYYGTGYLMKALSDSTKGYHFETHITSWESIASSLKAYSLPKLLNHSLDLIVDNGAGAVKQQLEINKDDNDPNKPLFFIGSTTGHNNLKCYLTAEYSGDAGVTTLPLTIMVNHDSTKAEKIIPAMLAQENLRILFAKTPPLDTARIVTTAVQAHLLCDYTALLALEPNDTIKFMVNPFDESRLVDVETDTWKLNDSSDVHVYPNPFNGQTNITFTLKEPSRVKVEIYNLLGELVREIGTAENASGKLNFRWDGKNSRNQSISSGIYIVRAVAKGNVSQKTSSYFKKLILLK